MKKKILSLCLVVAMVATAVVGASMAYLTDTEEAVNVMTLGNVDIIQNEQERKDKTKLPTAEENLQAYTQNKPLYPAVYEGDSIPWDKASETDQAWKIVDRTSTNVVDKFVTVTNNGKSDAYVRTWFAIEAGPDGVNDSYVHIVINGDNITEDATWEWTWLDEFATIGDTDYCIAVATYTGKLAPEATTIPSLKQVYMDKTATNEVVALYGETYDIKVFSQAIQTEGFTDAEKALTAGFGSEHPWAGGDPWDGTADTSWYDDDSATEFVLDSAEDVAGFAKLVNEGNGFSGKTIKLAADVNLAGHEWTPIGQTNGYYAKTYFQGTFDGQGHTISGLTITTTNSGGTYAAGFFGFIDAAGATIQNVTFDGAVVTGHHWTGVAAGYLSGTMTNVTVKNSTVRCTHANNDACGDKAGAVVGQINGTQGKMSNCSAADCTVTAGRDAGQVVGAANNSQVSNCSATNVTMTATGDCTGANITDGVIGRNL